MNFITLCSSPFLIGAYLICDENVEFFGLGSSREGQGISEKQ